MTTPADIPAALSELCRRDFQVFVERVFATLDPAAELERAPYLEILSDYLARAERGEIRRLLITIPPRHLKSIATSVALPAWMLGRDPTRRILTVSYANDLTKEHSRNFQKVISSGWYAHTFTDTALSIERNTIAEVRTRQNGFRRGASFGGSLTGFGADTIIIDDLMKAADARSPVQRENVRHFYGNTLVSRLNDKSQGTIIAVQQRLHEDDLAAHLQTMGYEHLNLPAIAEDRQVFALSTGRVHVREPGDLLKPRTEPRVILDEFRQAMGGSDFEAQYQQNPTPPDSALIEWSRIKTYEEAPPRERLQYVVQSWDTAFTTGRRPTSRCALPGASMMAHGCCSMCSEHGYPIPTCLRGYDGSGRHGRRTPSSSRRRAPAMRCSTTSRVITAALASPRIMRRSATASPRNRR
jgi:hypothetical protein